MRQEKQEIDQQLRAIQGSNMGSMQAFPSSRRSERAYSTDYDSSRSNRGSMRGRGSNRGRNSMSSNNPRYSNNRRNDRTGLGAGGDDTEEEYHRGGSYSNSGKYRGGSSRGGSGNNYSHNKPSGGKGDYRRGGAALGLKDDQQQQLRDGSSVDRGNKFFLNIQIEFFQIILFHTSESQSSNENTNRRRRRNNNTKNPTHSCKFQKIISIFGLAYLNYL